MLPSLDASGLAVDRVQIRILVLDDDPFMLKLLERMLAEQGFLDVTVCESGREAIRRVKRRHRSPQLILCDLNMPEMDGAESVRELVACRYEGSLFVVSGENERVVQAAKRLVRAHSIRLLGSLGKPVSRSALTTFSDRRRLLRERLWVPLTRGPAMMCARQLIAANL